MEIRKIKGKLFDDDEMILIKTDGEEAFKLKDLSLLINLMTINEIKRSIALYGNDRPIYFEKAVNLAMELGKKGIDLTLPGNEQTLFNFCKANKLRFKQVKQTKLMEYGI